MDQGAHVPNPPAPAGNNPVNPAPPAGNLGVPDVPAGNEQVAPAAVPIIPPANPPIHHVPVYEPAARPRTSKQIRQNNPANDLRFIVGPQHEVVSCQSQALCAASRFLDQQVQVERQHAPPGVVVEIVREDIPAVGIYRMIDYYEEEKMNLLNEEALPTVFAAQAYAMRDLERVAYNHFQKSFTPETALLRLQQARDLGIPYAAEYAKGLVEFMAAKVLPTPSILSPLVTDDTLNVVFGSDRLNLTRKNERLIFEALYRITQHRTGKETPKKESFKEVLGPLFNRLRVELMEPGDFGSGPAKKMLKKTLGWEVFMNITAETNFQTGFDRGQRIPVNIVTKTVDLVIRRTGTNEIAERSDFTYMLRFDMVKDLMPLLGVLLVDAPKPEEVVFKKGNRAVHGYLNSLPGIVARRYRTRADDGSEIEVAPTGEEVFQGQQHLQPIKYGKGVLAIRKFMGNDNVAFYYLDVGLHDLAELIEGSQPVGFLEEESVKALERFVEYVAGRRDDTYEVAILF